MNGEYQILQTGLGKLRIDGGGGVVEVQTGGVRRSWVDHHNIVSGGIPGTGFGTSSLEVREIGETGSTQSGNPAYLPRIGFHWSTVVALQIGMSSGGEIQILNNPGTDYEAFRCARLVTENRASVDLF